MTALGRTEHTEAARHFSLQLVLENINNKWARLSPKDVDDVKGLSLQALVSWPTAVDPPYLRKKLALIPTEVAKRVWPQRYYRSHIAVAACIS